MNCSVRFLFGERKEATVQGSAHFYLSFATRYATVKEKGLVIFYGNTRKIYGHISCGYIKTFGLIYATGSKAM